MRPQKKSQKKDRCPRCGYGTIRPTDRKGPIYGKVLFYKCGRCGYTDYKAGFEQEA